jgi:hypothetical protein
VDGTMTATRSRRGEEGAALIEFALTLPLLLLIIGGICDFGLLLQRYAVLSNAAREGARMGSLPGYTESDVTARVSVEYTFLGPIAAAFDLGTFNTKTLTAKSVMRTEVAAGGG